MAPAPLVAHPGRKPKGGGPERRAEILAHADSLFSEHGVQNVSTRQIAVAVGISQPSLYAYFPTKQALVEEVTQRTFLSLAARMLEMLRQAPGPGKLARLARAYIDFGLAHPDAYRVAFMIEGPPREGPSAAVQAGEAAFAVYRSAAAHAWGAGKSDAEIDLMARSAWAAVHGLVSLLIARPSFPWGDRQRLIEMHIARLFPDA